MPKRREEFVARITAERERNFMLPGSEHDMLKSSNDWIATIMSYVVQARQRGYQPVAKDEYEDELIKAAAIILAALEHSDTMTERGLLKTDV